MRFLLIEIPRLRIPSEFSCDRLISGKSRLGTTLLIVLSLVFPVAAENTESSESYVPKILESARQQVPTDPEAAAERAEFLAKNVPAAPLPAGSTQLDDLRARAANLQKQHAQYLQDIASGKTIPHADLHETLPQRIIDLKALTLSLGAISAETDPSKKQLLSKAFFTALQPIGSHLEIGADGEGYVNILSEQQQSELTGLEQAWDAANQDYDTKAESLQFLGTGQLYTITRLSVPIIVQAPPSSKVILQTFGGGFFPNKLALIEVEANSAGIAQTEWVSYGDSSGDTLISARSKAAPPTQNLTITTVQLRLIPLPEIPQNLPTSPAIPPLNPPSVNSPEN